MFSPTAAGKRMYIFNFCYFCLPFLQFEARKILEEIMFFFITPNLCTAASWTEEGCGDG
jgi:hypothetical protein